MQFPIDKIAHLARLELTEEEKTSFGKDIEQIIEHFDILNEVDTTGVKPLFYVHEGKDFINKKSIDMVRPEGRIHWSTNKSVEVPRVIE